MSTPTPTYRKLQVVRQINSFPEATAIRSYPLIEPASDQIRIRVIYTGVNMTDVNICTGRYFASGELPYDLGFEPIGIIDALGSAIVPSTHFKIGQPVLVTDPTTFDGFSEYLYKDPKYLIPLPALSPQYIVAYGSGLTAAIGIDIAGRVKPGDTVLVVAAAGGTGQIAAQWAKHRGGYVIGTTSSDEKAMFLKEEIGVDCVINYRKENLAEVLKEKFPKGIDVIWETVGGDSLKLLFNHLANRGRLCIVGSTNSYADSGFAKVEIPDWNVQLFEGSKTLVGFALFEYKEYFSEYLTKLIERIGNGRIKAKVDLGESSPGGVFKGLEDLARAEEWLQSGKNIGKVIVQIGEVV